MHHTKAWFWIQKNIKCNKYNPDQQTVEKKKMKTRHPREEEVESNLMLLASGSKRWHKWAAHGAHTCKYPDHQNQHEGSTGVHKLMKRMISRSKCLRWWVRSLDYLYYNESTTHA